MGKRRIWLVICWGAIVSLDGWVLAQRAPTRRPPLRRHQATQAGQLQLVPASEQPQIRNRVSIAIEGDHRVIRANGVPDHRTGPFPNPGNPHRLGAQSYQYRLPARPRSAEAITPLGRHSFGIAVNGVPFDPGAAEWYQGDPHGGWRYEPLSGAVPLGLDANHGHVQPSGAYHYHGLPRDLLNELGVQAGRHSPIVGWAADGFPIYALYGHADPNDPSSDIRKLKSSYRLQAGNRPDGPGGNYDGTFLADYVYVPKEGDLDECQGRFGPTPDFPKGTYAYFLTEQWPVIPRHYRGTPSQDFQRRGPPRGPGHVR